jgi:hypothetical protein
MALLHVGPPMLQFGHPFLKGFDRIHACLLYQIVEVIYLPVRAGERGSIVQGTGRPKAGRFGDSSDNRAEDSTAQTKASVSEWCLPPRRSAEFVKAVKGSHMRKEVYCENCESDQPLVEHEPQTDEFNPYPWYDLTCGTCCCLIATIQIVPGDKPVEPSAAVAAKSILLQ